MELIDRDALIASINKIYGCCGGSVINETIDNAPTIEAVEVKHGEWINYAASAYIGSDECGDARWADRKFYRCSKCHSGTVIKHNYCPKCGTIMKPKT